MPQKIQMRLSNGNPSTAQLLAYRNTLNLKTSTPPSSLTAPIIQRIHNVRPGCNSCGK